MGDPKYSNVSPTVPTSIELIVAFVADTGESEMRAALSAVDGVTIVRALGSDAVLVSVRADVADARADEIRALAKVVSVGGEIQFQPF